MTSPVTVASGERSFSRLKLIKSFIRSSMTDDRLNSLATISIENSVARSLDTASLVKEFSELKPRRRL